VASGYRILRPGQNRGTLLDASLELWDRHFNTNARRQFQTMQRLVKNLVEAANQAALLISCPWQPTAASPI
jgi:NAD(P)-dependent dehydrogenase (short-subunit alcohol dehydrogenase family)